ncbi:MAG: carbohydrate ABC transporter permease, partial [Chloroflexi bacterium]|nr:carbohydrate ABC transporter permease [Chloroflexota bacterium]
MRQRSVSKISLNLILLIVVFIILFPVFYIVQTSLKSTADIYSGAFFFTAKTANYEEIFTGSRSNFAELTRNSLIVSSSVAIICGFIGSLAAYSISRLNWSRWVGGGILVWLLFINMMPPIVFVTPYYLWARAAG